MKQPTIFKNDAWAQRYCSAYESVLRTWPAPHESHLVDTRFGETHVISCGPTDAPPLVLLHGAGVSSTMWRPNIVALSAQRRVHAVDVLWDLGKGVPRIFPTSHGEANEWLVEVLAGLGCDRVDLVGLSYGGFLSLRFAIDQPDRVKGLVVLSPAASLTGLSAWFFISAISAVIVPTRPSAICRAISRYTAAKPIDEDLLEQWVVGMRGLRIPTPMNKIPPLVLSDEELRSLRPPTLLIMAEKEWACRDPKGALERFRRLVPQGKAEMLAQAGHIVSMDLPDLVSSHILEHLDAPPSAA